MLHFIFISINIFSLSLHFCSTVCLSSVKSELRCVFVPVYNFYAWRKRVSSRCILSTLISMHILDTVLHTSLKGADKETLLNNQELLSSVITNVWFRGDIVKRNQMLVTLRGWETDAPKQRNIFNSKPLTLTPWTTRNEVLLNNCQAHVEPLESLWYIIVSDGAFAIFKNVW